MTANTSVQTVVRTLPMRDAKGRFVKSVPAQAATAEVNTPIETLAKISDHYMDLFFAMSQMHPGQIVQVFARNADKSVCKAFGMVHRLTKINSEKHFPELVFTLFHPDNWHHECSGTDCHLYDVVDETSYYHQVSFDQIYEIKVQTNQKGNFWQIRLTFPTAK